MFNLFNFQLFADAGTLVNATGNYVNAYTGATEAFDSKNTLSAEMKDFYDTELLENARVDSFYAQFGKKQPLPRNHNGVVEWRKWNTFANATKLTEGVIPAGQKFGMSYLTGSVDQYGTYTAVTDRLELRAYDDVIMGATQEMGASAAETQERLIRDALYVGTNVMYCDNITLATGAVASTPTTKEGMESNATTLCKLTPTMVNKAATKMRKDKVPSIDGKYVAVIHPSVAYDLRQDKEWKDFHQYAAVTEIFNGEIGELHGVRFIEDPFAPVFQGADLASNSRTLLVNGAISAGAVTSITFDGGTVAADALIGRKLLIAGNVFEVTANTATVATVKSLTTSAQIADNTVIYPGEGAKDGVAAYATYFFGKESFGIIDPEGGALEMIIHDKSEVGGPLNQFSTIGYKFETNGATILYPERVLRVMSSSSAAAIDEGNV